MYIPNAKQNYIFCRLKLMVENIDTQLNEPTNPQSLQSSKAKDKENVIINLW